MNKNNPLTSIPDRKGRYIVLDTETTGFDINKDYLISIAAVEIVDGMITGLQFNGYVRTRDKKQNLKGNNNRLYFVEEYSNEIYQIEKHTLQNFLRFVGDSIIFAHNAQFDYKFISHELKKWNLPLIPFENFRCSLTIAKNIIKNNNKNLSKYTVEYLCRHFGFNYLSNDFHHAYYDAFMCARIICKIYEILLNQREKETFEALIIKVDDNSNRNVINRSDLMDVCSVNYSCKYNQKVNSDRNNIIQDQEDDFISEEDDDYEKDPNFTISELVNDLEKVYIKKNYGLKNELKENLIEKHKRFNIEKIEDDFLNERKGDQFKNKIKNIMKKYVKNINK